MHSLTVRTGARLHFGPFAVGADTGRRFGGLGMMVDRPSFEISIETADRDCVVARPETATRIRKTLSKLRTFEEFSGIRGCRIVVNSEVPSHQGLGSGTQLELAIASGLARLAGLRLPAVELARCTGRGLRSAIGVHGFELGGFLIDGGKPDEEQVGELAGRFELPDSWRILLWCPRDRPGLSGDCEKQAFERLLPMSPELRRTLWTLAFDRVAGALKRHDCTELMRALGEYGRGVGNYFAPIQGGIYAHPRAAAIAVWLASNGVSGVAQSSWGPTLAVIVEGDAEAGRLVSEWPYSREELQISRPLNCGAEIRIRQSSFE